MANTDTTDHMLTTVDNPFDPFEQFDEWLAYDRQMGYNTLSFLARIAGVSPELSEADQSRIIDEAIDEIVRENVSGMWTKVARGEMTNESQ
jgi:hypothetical protein